MRILVTSFTYAPQRDGVQFVTQYLCEGLASKGHDVTVITQQHEGLLQHEIINGVKIERWPVYTHHMRHRGPRQQYVRRVLDGQGSFDVMINVGTETALTDWLLPYLSEIQIPKVLHIHSIWDFQIYGWDFDSFSSLAKKVAGNIRWGIYYLTKARAFKQYDRVLQLYPQDYSVKDFQRWYHIHCSILENAAEDAFHAGGPVPVSKRRHAVIYVANFNRLKNQDGVVKAFLQSDIDYDWELDLVGSSPTDEMRLTKQIESETRNALGLLPTQRPVRYFIGVNRDDIIRLVRTASVYVSGSKREAFSISLIEAMSAGIPWISTDVGITRYLPGGIVVSDAKSIGDVLPGLVHDTNRQSELAEKGYQYALQNFRIQDKVTELEKLLVQTVKEYHHER